MAEILLFHHVQGRTEGVVGFADQLRDAGHRVHTPDLFEGRTFPSIDDGVAYASEVGFDTVTERGVAAAGELPTGLVYAGFSMGVMPAQRLAQTRPGSTGALFFEACLPISEVGKRWPAGVPVQVHGMEADPFFAGEGDLDAARDLVAEASATATAELFLYSGAEHLFADPTLTTFDPGAAELLLDRMLTFLATT